MKKFQITVNGNAYDVEVEEVGAASAPAAAPAPTAPAAGRQNSRQHTAARTASNRFMAVLPIADSGAEHAGIQIHL